MDRQTYGRCYTALPTQEMMSYGIKWVKIYGVTEIGVYVHSPGLLETTRKTHKLIIKPGEYITFEIYHEVYEMLEYRKKPCESDLSFRKGSFFLKAFLVYRCKKT